MKKAIDVKLSDGSEHQILILDEDNIHLFADARCKVQERNFNILKAKLFLTEAYDIDYNLYNHNDPNLSHPFQQHLITEKKMIKPYGLFKQYMDRYYNHQILKFFGLSFTEFIQLPIDKVEDMFKATMSWAEKETAMIDDAKEEFERTVNKGDVQMNRQDATGFNF